MDYESADKPSRVTDTPAIGITLQYPLDEGVGRGLVFQTFVAADCSNGELNGALDKVRKAADRQRAIVILPTLRGMLADKQQAIHNATEAHFEAETYKGLLFNKWSQEHRASERRGELKLSSAQVAEQAKVDQQIGSTKRDIDALKKEIIIFERRVKDAEQLIAEGE
jgi:hypothetical protein